MKRIIIIVIFAWSMLTNAQVELKGIMIGSKFEGNVENKMVSTSVAGINGFIAIITLEDETIGGLMFVPANEEYKETNISIVEEEKMVLGLENKYKITFDKKLNDSPLIDYYYSAEKDGLKYSIIIKKDDYKTKSINLRLMISNNELMKKRDKEEQEKANKDF
mgnify:CR=1 FL=1